MGTKTLFEDYTEESHCFPRALKRKGSLPFFQPEIQRRPPSLTLSSFSSPFSIHIHLCVIGFAKIPFLRPPSLPSSLPVPRAARPPLLLSGRAEVVGLVVNTALPRTSPS